LLALPSPKGFFQPLPFNDISLVVFRLLNDTNSSLHIRPHILRLRPLRILPQRHARAPGMHATSRSPARVGQRLASSCRNCRNSNGSMARMPSNSNPNSGASSRVHGCAGSTRRKEIRHRPVDLLGLGAIAACGVRAKCLGLWQWEFRACLL